MQSGGLRETRYMLAGALCTCPLLGQAGSSLNKKIRPEISYNGDKG